MSSNSSIALRCLAFLIVGLAVLSIVPLAPGQGMQPMVAIHDSELTRALETVSASGATPTGAGTTGKQWWPTNWHYFVMPESMKEALRSDGTAFTVVSDANISAGSLLQNGAPRYPIVISLASEAVRDDEIAPLTNYVAAGGFLFVGSSSFTRKTDGTTRGDFAIANALGLHQVTATLRDWGLNTTLTKAIDHRVVSHIPPGYLTWRLPASSEETSWGLAPHASTPPTLAHSVWQVQASDATVLTWGDTYPSLTIKPYGKGYFIYCATMQPLICHGGWAPGMYAYAIFRNAIEWAFESTGIPLPRISPWPYPYDAAFMVRHDLENFGNEIADVEQSAQFEAAHGAKGDYYFCTGTLRQDMSSNYDTNAVVASLRRAIANYGATIGPHNGGLKNPTDSALQELDYDFWHWGPDEALNVTPSGYSSGKAYAQTSLGNSFANIESWLSGLMSPNLRVWCAPYFDATRENSYDIQAQLNVKITGEQKLGPFPHWTLSTQTANKRYDFLTEPVSEWFVNTDLAQSMEWHPSTSTTHALVDFYYNMGALINLYSHTLSTGEGQSGSKAPDYITYSLDPNLHPRLWSANAIGIYQWWLQRSNVQISVNYSTSGSLCQANVSISGATDPNATVELLIPTTTPYTGLQVLTNGVLCGTDAYRISGKSVKIRVGNTVNNMVVQYTTCSLGSSTLVFTENFDSITAPKLPNGWTTTASGAETAWTTQTTLRDTTPNAPAVPDPASVGLSDLVSPTISIPAGQTQLSFRNNYDLETGPGADGYDGGVLEIKIGSGAFTDIIAAGGSWVSGGYDHTIDGGYSSPIAGRQAWSGTSAGFIPTVVNLPAAAAGQGIQLRWRCGTDNGGTLTGWRIDTVTVNNRTWVCGGGNPNTNTAPILPTQANRTIAELTTLVVTNTASDSDLPPNALAYILLTAPANASISGNGIITWSPTEAQGPGTATFTTRVTDNGSPPLSATNSFIVTVNEVNSAPVLPVQLTRTVVEQSTLVVTNAATDPDLPANSLAYTLQNPPAGVQIDVNGIITWTPTMAQGPSTNIITTVVTDNGVPALSATNSFTVIVVDSVTAPVITLQPASRTNVAGTTATFTVGANGSSLTFQWFKNGTTALLNGGNVSGANTATLTLANVAAADAANYIVVVSNTAGTATSSAATLTVLLPPAIVVQPVSRTNSAGTVATFSVQAGGTTPSYQWVKNGTMVLANVGNISGANTAMLSLSNVTIGDTAAYAVIVTNLAGSVTSSPATLTVVTNTGPSTLFSDDFTRSSDPGPLSPWVLQQGSWTVTTGVLKGTAKGNQPYAFVYTSSGWPDYSVQGQVQFASGANGGGLGGRLDPTTGAHYSAWVYPAGAAGSSNVVKLLKFKTWKTWSYQGSSSAAIAQANLPNVGTNWHTLTLTVAGSQLTVTFDGVQVIAATDNEATPYTNGRASVDGGTGPTKYSMSVDNVIVNSAAAGPLANAIPNVMESPRIESVTINNGDAVIRWSAVAGVTYRLQYKDDLTADAWVDAQPDVTATDTTAIATDSIGSAPQRFYRVLVVQ